MSAEKKKAGAPKLTVTIRQSGEIQFRTAMDESEVELCAKTTTAAAAVLVKQEKMAAVAKELKKKTAVVEWSEWQPFMVPSMAFGSGGFSSNASMTAVPRMLAFEFHVFSKQVHAVQFGILPNNSCSAAAVETSQVFIDDYGRFSDTEQSDTSMEFSTHDYAANLDLLVDGDMRVMFLSPGQIYKVRWVRPRHVVLTRILSTEALNPRYFVSPWRVEEWPLIRPRAIRSITQAAATTTAVAPPVCKTEEVADEDSRWLKCEESGADLLAEASSAAWLN